MILPDGTDLTKAPDMNAWILHAGKEPQIFKALNDIMKDVKAIAKSKRTQGPGFSYSYRGIDDVYNALNPKFGEHGVSILIRSIEERRSEVMAGSRPAAHVVLKIVYRFAARDGSYVECVGIGEGVDTSDKATNKAMSYAQRYCLQQMFLIPTEDMKDPDGEYLEITGRGNAQGNGNGNCSARNNVQAGNGHAGNAQAGNGHAGGAQGNGVAPARAGNVQAGNGRNGKPSLKGAMCDRMRELGISPGDMRREASRILGENVYLSDMTEEQARVVLNELG